MLSFIRHVNWGGTKTWKTLLCLTPSPLLAFLLFSPSQLGSVPRRYALNVCVMTTEDKNCEISVAYYCIWHVNKKKKSHEDLRFSNALACHNLKWKRFFISLFDLHSSLVTPSLSPLSKATNIRGKASVGQGQSFALTEHKCITSGLNYLGITRCVVPRHCASHNRFKQVENVFRREQQHQPQSPCTGKRVFNMHSAGQAANCTFEIWTEIVFTSRFVVTVDDNVR